MAKSSTLDFSAQIRAFADKSISEIEEIRESAQKAVIKGIIEKTPVDTGQARMNWIATKGSPANYSIPLPRGVKQPSAGAQAMAAAFSQTFGEDGELYFVNNTVYANVLEFGQYPSPVKFGSWNKNKKFYEVKSTGGYSYQAPQGMARLTVQTVADNLKAKYG